MDDSVFISNYAVEGQLVVQAVHRGLVVFPSNAFQSIYPASPPLLTVLVNRYVPLEM